MNLQAYYAWVSEILRDLFLTPQDADSTGREMMLNKQQLCAELAVSESTVRRLEQRGMPYTPGGSRSHRYDLDECKRW